MPRKQLITSILTAIVGASALGACNQSSGGDSIFGVFDQLAARDSLPLFQTDSLAYTLKTESGILRANVLAVFTNRTSSTVYFSNCNGATGYSFERREGNKWVVAWSPALPACLSPAITVAPGASRTWQVPVHAGLPGSRVEPKFDVPDPAGEYRIVWYAAYVDYSIDRFPFGTTLPLNARVSNGFLLRSR